MGRTAQEKKGILAAQGLFVYSLPNGLWAYSFMFFMSFIWGDVKSLGKTFFIVLVVALTVGSEMGQWLKLLPGTFCLTDVLLYSGGLLFGYYQGKIF